MYFRPSFMISCLCMALPDAISLSHMRLQSCQESGLAVLDA